MVSQFLFDIMSDLVIFYLKMLVTDYVEQIVLEQQVNGFLILVVASLSLDTDAMLLCVREYT